MLALAEAYSDLEELSAVAGISQESLARMHGFIVEAIVEKAESELVRAELDSEADARLAKVLTLGATIPWSEMRPYLENRLAGKNGNPPAQQSMIANAEARMTTNLVLQNVDAGLALALKQRAAEHGLSAEAEHHEILRNALQGPQRRPFAEVLASMPDVGEDADFDARNG
jgi:plasmid stability protein